MSYDLPIICVAVVTTVVRHFWKEILNLKEVYEGVND